ncbi:nuclear transport factor 2 family protein [Nocardioides speluncae]|uniref:nuclear transport factor 2 family protein n=1 Tax=Nocardioides speluncae TaxID=2670337 RepID=UPI000D69D28A|nr:nuclear transport factor 2 family protein [Nocardioides speluncae]
MHSTTTQSPAFSHLVSRLGHALDSGSYDNFREVFTAEASIRTPGGEQQGIERIIGQAAASHDDYDVTQHLFGDVHTEVDGDRATVTANAIVTLVPDAEQPEMHRMLGARYGFDAVHTDAGWRFDRMAITPLWSRE